MKILINYIQQLRYYLRKKRLMLKSLMKYSKVKKKKISKTVMLIYAAQTALGLGMAGCFMLIGFLLKKLLRKLIK